MACIDGFVRREAGLPMTLANPLILNVSIHPVGSTDVGLWHEAEVQGCYILGPITAA